MLRWVRDYWSGVGSSTPLPTLDNEFVAVVREHFDPVVLPAGFVFNSASTGVRSQAMRRLLASSEGKPCA